MESNTSCKHAEITAKYTWVKHNINGAIVELRVYSWVCDECGEHGSETEQLSA